MGKKADRAEELFRSGYNCSQSVFGAFAEDLGLDFDTAIRISSSFGGGVAHLRDICGVVSGMCMVLGAKYGDYEPNNNALKTKHYERVQSLIKEFSAHNGSFICRDLLGINAGTTEPAPEERTSEYYKRRSCPELVHDAAEILEKYLENADA